MVIVDPSNKSIILEKEQNSKEWVKKMTDKV